MTNFGTFVSPCFTSCSSFPGLWLANSEFFVFSLRPALILVCFQSSVEPEERIPGAAQRMPPGLHGELHRQVLRAWASSSLHLVHSKVSYQGHWGGSNQRAPSGVKQPCWNIERWFFFLLLTKWQSHQLHCGLQLRQEYLPGKCLFDFFFFLKPEWLSPFQTCMNTSVQD